MSAPVPTLCPQRVPSRRAAARPANVALLLWLAAVVSSAVAAGPSEAWGDEGAANEERVTIDVHEAPLLELTLYFSALTEQNFVLLDKDLEDKTITIYAPHPVTIDEARELFIAALRLNGLDVQVSDAYWKIDRVHDD